MVIPVNTRGILYPALLLSPPPSPSLPLSPYFLTCLHGRVHGGTLSRDHCVYASCIHSSARQKRLPPCVVRERLARVRDETTYIVVKRGFVTRDLIGRWSTPIGPFLRPFDTNSTRIESSLLVLLITNRLPFPFRLYRNLIPSLFLYR